MQVAVDQRLGAGHEVPLGGAEGGDDVGIVRVGGDVGWLAGGTVRRPPAVYGSLKTSSSVILQSGG